MDENEHICILMITTLQGKENTGLHYQNVLPFHLVKHVCFVFSKLFKTGGCFQKEKFRDAWRILSERRACTLQIGHFIICYISMMFKQIVLY